MKGYVEESEEVTTFRELRRAATAYAGRLLLDSYESMADVEKRLRAAALGYAATQKAVRRKKGARAT